MNSRSSFQTRKNNNNLTLPVPVSDGSIPCHLPTSGGNRPLMIQAGHCRHILPMLKHAPRLFWCPLRESAPFGHVGYRLWAVLWWTLVCNSGLRWGRWMDWGRWRAWGWMVPDHQLQTRRRWSPPRCHWVQIPHCHTALKRNRFWTIYETVTIYACLNNGAIRPTPELATANKRDHQ